MKKPAITIDNLTKQYYLEKPRTLKKWFRTMFAPFERFTVLKNLSLTVDKGEFVLITGPNGSGKTTLLKLIAGITEPDRGKIITYGKIVPLIELGAGFNYELTGKENIITNAAILGISKQTLKKIIPKIINYSGIKNFIEVPLKRYSTGMLSRLAFSIAVYSDPDIILIDEIFAVGDSAFQQKCLLKMKEFKNNQVSLVIVSHSLEKIKDYCEKGLVLHNGSQVYFGTIDQALSRYKDILSEKL